MSSGDLHLNLQLRREAQYCLNRQPWPVVRVCRARCAVPKKCVMPLAALETALAPSASNARRLRRAPAPCSGRHSSWSRPCAPYPKSNRRKPSPCSYALGPEHGTNKIDPINLMQGKWGCSIGQWRHRQLSCPQGSGPIPYASCAGAVCTTSHYKQTPNKHQPIKECISARAKQPWLFRWFAGPWFLVQREFAVFRIWEISPIARSLESRTPF
jgi:hypothetical protein